MAKTPEEKFNALRDYAAKSYTEEIAKRVEERIRAKLRAANVRPEHRLAFEGFVKALNMLWDSHQWTAAQILRSAAGDSAFSARVRVAGSVPTCPLMYDLVDALLI